METKIHLEKNKIVIVEDQEIVREGLKSLLTSSTNFEIIGEAEDGIEAVKCILDLKPDFVLLDLAMPKMNGLSVIKDIKNQIPTIIILVLTFHTEEEYVLEAFRAGVDGYCLKNDTKLELMTAIQSVLAGKKYFSSEISDKVLEGYIEGRQTLKTETSYETLTRREREILKLVGEGHTSPEIAEMLCISVKTVDKHRSNIMKKLDLHNASALTAFAIDKGLVLT